MKKKGLIIFDFDGVIIDSAKLMYEHTKKRIPFLSWKVYQRIFDHPLLFKFIRMYKLLFPKMAKGKFKKQYSEYTNKKLQTTPLIIGMDALIIRLADSYELALNTNASIPNSVPILEKYKIKKYFSIIETRENSPSKKERLLRILNELNREPHEALFITDSVRDVMHAKDVNMKSIGVSTGMQETRHFKKSSIQTFLFGMAHNSGELENLIGKYFKQNEKTEIEA